MSFWTYRQNNSGGGFDYDHSAGLSNIVIIEAPTLNQANGKALDIGIYFDGIEKGWDCGCCGDRWSEPWRDEEGTPEPTIYGSSIEEYFNDKWHMSWTDGNEIYVHYADGTVKGFKKEGK